MNLAALKASASNGIKQVTFDQERIERADDDRRGGNGEDARGD